VWGGGGGGGGGAGGGGLINVVIYVERGLKYS